MATERFNRLRIATADGIEFGLELAGPLSRMLAWLLDAIIIVGINTALVVVVMWVVAFAGLLAPAAAMDWGTAFLYLGVFIVSIGYGIWFEWRWRGQTIGKRVLRLRVVDVEGLKLSFPQVLLRNLLRVVDMLPLYYFVGGAVSAWTRYSQRLGDLAAGTVVVRVSTGEPPPAVRFEEGHFNSLREHPLLVARLRSTIAPDEARLAWQALMRRESLHPESRVEIYRELADRFRARLPTRMPEVETLPDEALLRGVLDVVLERSGAAEDKKDPARKAGPREKASLE